jgi:hypothetical protein
MQSAQFGSACAAALSDSQHASCISEGVVHYFSAEDHPEGVNNFIQVHAYGELPASLLQAVRCGMYCVGPYLPAHHELRHHTDAHAA